VYQIAPDQVEVEHEMFSTCFYYTARRSSIPFYAKAPFTASSAEADALDYETAVTRLLRKMPEQKCVFTKEM